MDKIAYLVMCHKNEQQVMTLINSLVDKYADVYVHVDKKNTELYQKLSENFNKIPSVNLLEERVAVFWGGFSQLRAIIGLIKAVVKSGTRYSYVSLISGQDLLIKPHLQFYKYLERCYPKEFIELERHAEFDARINTFQVGSSISRYKCVRGFNYCLRYIYNHFHVGIKKFRVKDIYKGGTWWTLTGKSLEKIMEYVDANPVYVNRFKHTICADEHFIQMLIKKLGIDKWICNNNLRYIDWENCKDNPKILTNDDYEKIMNSSAFIGRKFDMEKDSIICDRLIEYSRKKDCL
ncbi:beta-1,6-N-acetylglucosaminyltransferase [Butyricimonas paravirosa]|uniref:beta-1,6-N-acetylglucosaminyltransferase n=1 Tax=Butyricimonas paravirosa TaxID=1472417 RepID=UPI0022E06FD2|nr:beta-1,6-N-acetylglucosaminyltransferase [Butyricimonas paravirosa]